MKTIESTRTHECVQHSPTQSCSVLAYCRALLGTGERAHLAAYASRDETSPGPAMDYGCLAHVKSSGLWAHVLDPKNDWPLGLPFKVIDRWLFGHCRVLRSCSKSRTGDIYCSIVYQSSIISSLLLYNRFLTSFLYLHPSLFSAPRLSATKPTSLAKSCSIWILLLRLVGLPLILP